MNSKKIITWAGLALLLVSGLILITWPRTNLKPKENSAGVTAKNQQLHDFGRISMAGGKVSHRYQIQNQQDSSLIVKKIYTSCMCTEASLLRGNTRIGPFGMPGHGPIPALNEQFGPNDEIFVEAAFDPAAHGPAGLGKVARQVILETSTGQIELSFTAEVTP